jgi:ornithine cyclodeaminase
LDRVAQRASAQALVDHARTLGLQAEVAPDADAALADCPLAVTCTPASGVVLRAHPRADGFIAAVGAFTPQMVELAPELCRTWPRWAHRGGHARCRARGGRSAAGRPGRGGDAHAGRRGAWRIDGPVLFKSCGWAGWDLAAARLAMRG